MTHDPEREGEQVTHDPECLVVRYPPRDPYDVFPWCTCWRKARE